MSRKAKILDNIQDNLSGGLERITEGISRNFTRIRYVDGHRFKLAVIAAAKRLIANQDYLNKINVFPVPDGDTGTNMASTLHTIIVSLRHVTHRSINDMSSNISELALEGARGNSGVILAQFFYGLAQELEGKKHVTTRDFAAAAEQSVHHSYRAMEEPREGTILSVIRIWAESWRELAWECDDFVEILDVALKRTQDELAQSPAKLKVLQDSKVVDAGAQGFVNMLEGINDFIKGGKIREIWEEILEKTAPYQQENGAIAFDPDIEFRYCTECLVDAEDIPREEIRGKLKDLGNSMILAGSKTHLKLHIHTDEPEKVFSILEEYGTVRRKKADDMKKQVKVRGLREKGIALVVDSTSDLPEDILTEYNINVVPVRISFGNKEFIDKVTIDNATFYKKLEQGTEHPKTSQPSPRDFSNMYRYLTSHYDQVLSIHLTKALSGTYQSAKAAAEDIAPDAIRIFDTKMTSLGTGLAALKAAQLIREDKTMDEIIHVLHQYVLRSRLYIIFGGLEFVVKGGRLNKNVGSILSRIGLLPLIYFDKEGKLGKEGFIRNRSDNFLQVMKRMKKHLNGQLPESLAVVHANALQKAENAKREMERLWPGVPVFISELGPALGVHAGPGTIGIGFFRS